MGMGTQLTGTSVYLGDIHGTRLEHVATALQHLNVAPDALLCTMDLDQVLSMQDLLQMEQRYQTAGKQTLLVPGNHEAAVIHRIGIDSSTYRKSHQDTNILQLIEALNLPAFSELKQDIENRLEIDGGQRIELAPDDGFSGLLIHGALDGKEEKYLSEYPAELQQHVRARTDLWLRLETDVHLRANFAAMQAAGLKVMLRGHDHYLAMRSLRSEDELCSHQLVVNVVSDGTLEHRAEPPRSHDSADDIETIDTSVLSQAQSDGSLYWHRLDPGHTYVINCGPYYQGYFGLVKTSVDDTPPAVAFCQTRVSVYNEEDRKQRLVPHLSAHQARSGKTFYELFPRGD